MSTEIEKVDGELRFVEPESGDAKAAPAARDLTDLRSLVKLLIWAAVILGAAAVLGLAIRVFVAASGLGG